MLGIFESMRTFVLTLVCSSFFIANATQWDVGPGLTYTAPSQVAPLVGNGDTVNIVADIYQSDVTNWTADDLLLRGIGGMAHMKSNGAAWGGKGIWVIQGDRTTVEWIRFSQCSVPDMNGAGIRQEGKHLTVRYCDFRINENGILAGDNPGSNITIEHTDFGYNGYGDGFSHNLYINHVDTLFFRYNYSHHAHVGHELKSRATVNFIEYNRISNEATGDASREVDLPNGGQVFLIGNIIQQGPMSPNSNMVGYGLEGLINAGPHEFHAINNTLVNEKTNGSFFHVANGPVLFKGWNNVLAGGGVFMASGVLSLIDTVGNVRRSNIADLQFADALNYDYHITSSSPASGAGIPAGYSNSNYALVAWDEYVHPVNSVVRCQHALLDAGAFEGCTVGISQLEQVHGPKVWPNPGSDIMYIQCPKCIGPVDISVVDVQGRSVMEGRGSHINVSDLKSGTYLIHVRTAEHVHSERVIIAH